MTVTSCKFNDNGTILSEWLLLGRHKKFSTRLCVMMYSVCHYASRNCDGEADPTFNLAGHGGEGHEIDINVNGGWNFGHIPLDAPDTQEILQFDSESIRKQGGVAIGLFIPEACNSASGLVLDSFSPTDQEM